ncbi:MAG TPA: methionyl-tRNA formyltransferase [Candidatus Paceibacterota bacterium]|jgi:methionyl-tRNA formyltransferase|nr:methionyl-tRNA formyltransferase [Candidatus Paceibacterota bacterium]HRU35913.1 methionyl-tRNA formyltransferase [Candidatus Paceibacterota bacterium]
MKNDNKNNYKIIFWGTSYFGAKILESLVFAGFSPILVVTTPESKKGRGLQKSPSEVKKMAKKWGLEVIEPIKLKENEEFLSYIKQLNPDVFIIASYGKIIPAEYLIIPSKGAINVHPSLLPKWRGPSPIQTAILNGDKKTGVTIMLVDEKMDHGAILNKAELEIKNSNFKKLEENLIEIASQLLIETLPQWLRGKIKPIPQNHKKATYSKIIKKEDGLIDFKKSAEVIERKIRAFEVWPNVYFQRKEKIYKILEADVFKNKKILAEKKVGEFFCFDKKLIVKCGKEGLIIKKIQPENKKPMDGYSFWCGYQNKL